MPDRALTYVEEAPVLYFVGNAVEGLVFNFN